jgi:C-terminal processing protease CtpA/Prc
MQGGTDYRLALSIKKVTPGTTAHTRLNVGDVIVAIQGSSCSDYTHEQANSAIRGAGNTLTLMVRK